MNKNLKILKYFILFIVLTIILFNQNNKILAYESNDNFNFASQISYNSDLEVDKLIGLTDDIFVYEKNNLVFLNNNNNKIQIGVGTLKDSIMIESRIYVIINNQINNVSTLYLYDLSNSYTNNKIFENSTLNKIILFNNYLCLIGNTSSDASIYLLDLNLNLIKTKDYGGEGYEEFTTGGLDNQYLYLVLNKQGISKDSPFINFGDESTYKSILLKLDQNLNILKTLYLSLDDNNIEKINNIVIDNHHINLILESIYTKKFYSVNNELEIIDTIYLNNINNYYLLENHKSDNNYLTIVKNDITTLESFNNQENEIIYNFNDGGEILHVNNYLGNLVIYFKSFGQIKSYVLSEYEIIKNEPLELSYLNYDFSNNSNVIIKSYFEELSYNLDQSLIEPYYENGIYGEYLIKNVYLKKNNQQIIVPSKLIVKEYANFINNGMYSVGFIPKYFGHCYLNGELIHLGYEFTTPGIYDLELSDNYNNKKKFQIYIMDDYYLKQSNTTYSNIELIKEPNIDLEITYELPNDSNILCDLNITNLYINNNEYTNFTYDNNYLKVYITEDSLEVKKLEVNYFEYIYNNQTFTYDLDDIIYYQTRRSEPSLVINKTINKKNVIFSIDISDPNTTFEYLKVQTKHDNIMVINDVLYNNKIYELKSTYDYQTTIDFYYNDGHNLLSEKLCEYSLINSSLKYKLEFYYEKGYIKNITITFDIPKDPTNVNKLIIGSSTITTYYSSLEPSHLLRNIFLISALVFIIVLLYFKVLRKNKKKVYI